MKTYGHLYQDTMPATRARTRKSTDPKQSLIIHDGTLAPASKLLTTQLNRALIDDDDDDGNELSTVYQQIGRYLALQYLPHVLPLETYDLFEDVDAIRDDYLDDDNILTGYRFQATTKSTVILDLSAQLDNPTLADGVAEVMPDATLRASRSFEDISQGLLSEAGVVVLACEALERADVVLEYLEELVGKQGGDCAGEEEDGILAIISRVKEERKTTAKDKGNGGAKKVVVVAATAKSDAVRALEDFCRVRGLNASGEARLILVALCMEA